ncbi:General transcription factor II-I repeat domain-containing protein 2A [Acipenser ruthenus]|uniref:General transcription factor II-I repeat domain-containing protein 2A n=1 Tax=Acipenser ruthenus TaxID=7906 RepID=A0A444U5G6_ACIRT|nr:General transcription factor II-I repeat domain-containing protein 2A [Acipenser ruthenus]
MVKQCMVTTAETLFAEKKDVVEAFRQLPLSDTTAIRRAEIMAQDVFKQLSEKLKTGKFSMAVDESCDIRDTAQLAMYVRFFDGEKFVEDLLSLIPHNNRTTGEDLFNSVQTFLSNEGFDVNQIVSITTDGAPAMIGTHRGLVKRLQDLNPNLISYHCAIHQTALCAKLSDEYSNVMSMVIKLVNFLQSKSALQHRQFKSFLSEVSADYDDLLVQNDIRWLSRGQVLRRLWEIRVHVEEYLHTIPGKRAEELYTFLRDAASMSILAFLVDLTGHLNDFNLKLQGRNHNVVDLHSSVASFKNKLSLFKSDLETGGMLHFPTLISCRDTADVHQMTSSLDRLLQNFQHRFQEFESVKDVFLFVKNPFVVQANGTWCDQAKASFPDVEKAKLQLELIDLQSDEVLKMRHTETTCETFWTTLVLDSKYPHLRKVAFNILTMFGSTYVCESAFSTMNNIKSRNRSVLTDNHLCNCLRLALTELTPNFKALVHQRTCHFSH